MSEIKFYTLMNVDERINFKHCFIKYNAQFNITLQEYIKRDFKTFPHFMLEAFIWSLEAGNKQYFLNLINKYHGNW